jgi:hypothetical protein
MLLCRQRLGQVCQIIRIGVGLTCPTTLQKSQKNIKYCYEDEGGRGVALPYPSVRMEGMFVSPKHLLPS